MSSPIRVMTDYSYLQNILQTPTIDIISLKLEFNSP